jgi:mono/diheme cytochrome c family protein
MRALNKSSYVIGSIALLVVVAAIGIYLTAGNPERNKNIAQKPEGDPPQSTQTMAAQGMDIFRYDTYGDEYYFTDTLKLPFETLLATPADAREKTLGVMTDKDGKVVGIQEVTGSDGKKRWGVTCAFCHSVVNKNGERLDGVPNTRLNVGAILALSPTIDNAKRKQLLSWGPGKLDVTFNNEADDGVNNPAVMEAAFGTKGIKYFNWNGTFTSAEERSHFTMDIVGHGNGEFKPPASWGITNQDLGDGIDLIGPKMPAVIAYLETIEPPAPNPGSFDQAKAASGQALFMGKANCNRCHTQPLFTNNEKVKPEVVGTDPKHADSPVFKDGTYKVPQLRGVWAVAPYFHDGSARTLLDVVNHYNQQFKINLSETEKGDLVEYLKSLH